jgi:hypothetical protein
MTILIWTAGRSRLEILKSIKFLSQIIKIVSRGKSGDVSHGPKKLSKNFRRIHGNLYTAPDCSSGVIFIGQAQGERLLFVTLLLLIPAFLVGTGPNGPVFFSRLFHQERGLTLRAGFLDRLSPDH